MKYINLTIFFVTIFSNQIFAQESSEKIRQIESLIDLSAQNNRANQDSATICANQALELAQEINSKIYIAKSYEQLGQAYRYQNEQDKARKYYKAAIKFYGNDEEKVAKLEHWLGHTYAAESDFQQAIAQYQIANEYATTHKDTSLLANCALDIGVIYARKGEFYVAIEYFFNSVEYYDAVKETRHIVPLLNNIGSIYLDTRDYEKGLIYLKKAEERLKKMPEYRDSYFVHITTNIGICYYNLNQFDEAITYYEAALKEAEKIDDSYIKATVYNQLGLLFIETKDFKQAQFFYRKSFEVTKKENYRAEYAAALKGLAIVDKEKGLYNKALKQLEEANLINKEVENLDNIVSDYELFASIYEELGNSSKAYNYLKDYMSLKDSVFNIDKEAEIALMESKYNYTQEETKLTTEVQNLKKNEKIQQSRQAILILILILISIVGGALYWFLSKNRKENSLLKKDLQNKAIIEKQAEELKHLNEILEDKVEERTNELQAVNENLEQANYELRTFNYIASHDIKEPIRVIGGYVGLIYKQLTPELKVNLESYFDTIKKSSKQLYTLVEDFARYTNLSKGDEIETEEIDLNYLIDSIIDNLHDTIQKCNGQVSALNLPKIQSNASILMSILKNLIENGLKYNQSKIPTVEIGYSQTETHYNIIVKDNGIGIKKDYHEKIFEMFKRLQNRFTI